MPLIHLEITESMTNEQREAMCQDLSRLCAEGIGKPERYVQAMVIDGVAMLHGGAAGPTAFVDVRSIGGLPPKVCRTLSERVCQLLQEKTQVPGERIYLNFTEVPATNWGTDHRTFG